MSEDKTGTMTTGKLPPETVFQSKEYFMDREKKFKAELAALRAENDRLKTELSQCNDLDNVMVSKGHELQKENARLKAEIKRLADADFVWREKCNMLNDDLAKAWGDKRELVDAITKYLFSSNPSDIDILQAAVEKHREG